MDAQGRLIPSTKHGDNLRIQGYATGKLFYCDSQRIYPINERPRESAHYKTFSVYFHGGYGFWVLRGDALSPIPGEHWQPLRFDHSDTDYSSFLTNAGEHSTLRVQRLEQRWQSMLLPDIYHTSIMTDHRQYGGLTGELPILLALIALSTKREWVPNVLPMTFVNGAWAGHPYQVPSKFPGNPCDNANFHRNGQTWGCCQGLYLW